MARLVQVPSQGGPTETTNKDTCSTKMSLKMKQGSVLLRVQASWTLSYGSHVPRCKCLAARQFCESAHVYDSCVVLHCVVEQAVNNMYIKCTAIR
jgi:hypothetical protein